MFSNFDFDVIVRSLPYLFYDGMTFTLTLTAFATAGGIVFGTILAMMRLSGFAPVSLIATGYVNLMRSVPLLLVIFWFYFLVPYIGQWVTGADRPVQVGGLRLLVRHLHAVRGGVFRGDHARGHPVDPARPGLRGTGARHDLSADHGLRRPAASLPQHDADPADADNHLFQDTSLVYVLSITDFMGAASKIAQRDGRLVRDVLVRGAGLFPDLVFASQLVRRLQARIAIIR